MIKYFFTSYFLVLCSCNAVSCQTVKDSLWALLVNTHTDTGTLKILNQLHNYYQFEANNSRNVDSAAHYADEAYALSQKMNSDNVNILIAICNKAHFTFQEKKDPVNAIILYLQSNKIAEALHDSAQLSQGYLAIGNIYTYQHLTEKALANYLKSLYFAEPSNSKSYASIASNVLGYTYRSLSKLDSAEYFYKKAIDLSLKTPDKFRLQSYLYNIIDLYQSQNKREQAQNYLNLAFTYRYLPSTFLTNIAKQLNIGKYYQYKKEYNQAINNFMTVVNMKKKHNAVAEDELVVEAYRSLTYCYKEMNDYKNAYFFLEKLKTVDDSLNKIIYSRDTAMKIVELQATFNVERAETALKIQRNYNIGLLVLTLLIIGIASLIFRNNRIKENNNRKLMVQSQLLEQQKKELSELNATKDKLLGLIAHDIRAPLSSLTTLVTLWDAKIISGKKFDEISEKVRSNLHNLRISLDNLLVWSTSQLKGIKPKPEKISLQEIIKNELQLLGDTAENKNISLVCKSLPSPYWVIADSVQMSIVVRNILSNAIKFTNNGGHIDINITQDTNFVQTTISDNGIGMSQDLLNHLFLNQIDIIRRGTANEKGTGLGLGVAKEFVEANGGSLHIKSEENKGTEISFLLKTA